MGDAEVGTLGVAGQSLFYRDAEVVDLTLSGPAVGHSAGLWGSRGGGGVMVGHWAGAVLPVRASCWAEEENVCLAMPKADPGWSTGGFLLMFCFLFFV